MVLTMWSAHFLAPQNFSRLVPIAHLRNQLAEKGSLLRQALSGRLLSLKAPVCDRLQEMKKGDCPGPTGRRTPVGASGFALRAVDRRRP